MHLLEFMDQTWLPKSLRDTLRDILECGNSRPFRGYYDWIVDEVIRVAVEQDCDSIVELGAGTAPVTRHLLQRRGAENLKLIVCDLNPDRLTYDELRIASGGRVQPIYSPIDFSRQRDMEKLPARSLLILSATFHHIPPHNRLQTLNVLCGEGHSVLVFEPLRRTISSVLFVALSLVPAVVTPLRYVRRPGRMRRLVWCWVIPVGPLMFWWDGVVSCLRQWTTSQWRDGLEKMQKKAADCAMQSSIFSQLIYLNCDYADSTNINDLTSRRSAQEMSV
jgi:SAM-dependent methyltransferase